MTVPSIGARHLDAVLIGTADGEPLPALEALGILHELDDRAGQIFAGVATLRLGEIERAQGEKLPLIRAQACPRAFSVLADGFSDLSPLPYASEKPPAPF